MYRRIKLVLISMHKINSKCIKDIRLDTLYILEENIGEIWENRVPVFAVIPHSIEAFCDLKGIGISLYLQARN